MEDFSPLGAEMARLAGRLGTLAPAVCDRDELEWIVTSGRRLEAFAAAQAALATGHLERLLHDSHAESLRERPDEAAPDAADGAPDTDGTPRNADGPAPAASDAPPAGDDATASCAGAPEPAGDGATGGGGAAAAGSSTDSSGADTEAGAGGGRRESAEELLVRLRRSRWLRRCTLFAEALQAGTITPGHIDVMAIVLDRVEPHVVSDVLADEERLVEVARRMARTPFGKYLRDVIDRIRADGGMSRFERQLKESFASFKPDDDTQMYRLFCNVDPIRGAAMYQAVQARVDEMYQTKGATDGLSYGQVVLQALHDLICRESVRAACDSDEQDDDDVGGGPAIIVICDCQTWTSGEHAHTVCETYEGLRVPVSLVRDLCAEAMLTVAIAGADGQILEVGMTERLANRAQRRALRAKYRRCAHPGCPVPFVRCRIHHVTPWERQGPTDIGNLLPLCHTHHHLVHEGGWRLTIDTDRTLRWYRPGGALHTTTPWVPLLTPASQRVPNVGGSPPGANSGASPPSGSDPPPATAPAAAGDDLRLFDPPAA